MNRREALQTLIVSPLLATTLAGRNARAGSGARWVSIGGGVTETIFALDAGDRLVGTDTSSTWPEEAQALPQVGYQHTLTPEGILALRPDVLVHDGSAGPPTTLERVRKAGVDEQRLDGRRSLAGFEARATRLGEMLGRAEKARELIASVRGELEAAERRRRNLPRTPRVALVMTQGEGGAMVAGRDTKAHALLELAGAENIFADSHESYRPVSAESLLQQRPDGIIVTGRQAGQFRGRLARVPVFEADTLFLLGFGPRLGDAVSETVSFCARALGGEATT
ncbi:MAG: hemin ABC transporter substrate-binding protein [Guyparkeria sp.]